MWQVKCLQFILRRPLSMAHIPINHHKSTSISNCKLVNSTLHYSSFSHSPPIAQAAHEGYARGRANHQERAARGSAVGNEVPKTVVGLGDHSGDLDGFWLGWLWISWGFMGLGPNKWRISHMSMEVDVKIDGNWWELWSVDFDGLIGKNLEDTMVWVLGQCPSNQSIEAQDMFCVLVCDS